MPAVSKKQQKFMGIVRSIQKGEQPASKFNKDAQDVAKDMKKKDVKDFASTKHKGLPMKKEILGKLKEMIRQELSEYTYGVGDVVKDVNPTCPHFGAQGKVKSVNPRSVVFVVMNKGKNFKPGMELEKSHDQMKKMNENKVYKVGDTISLLSFDRRHRGRAKVKGVTKSRPNKFGIKNHYITNKGTFTDMEVEGTEAFKLRFKGDTEKKVTKAMNSPYGVVLPEQSVRLNEMNYKQFVKYMNDFYGPKGVYPDKKKRTLKMKDIGLAYSVLLKKKPDFEIGYDSTDREMIRDILIKQRKLDPDYTKKEYMNTMAKKRKRKGLAPIEGFASDAQRRAAFASGYKAKGKKKKKESVSEAVKVLKFTKVKDNTLEKHLKLISKKVGAKLSKINGGFKVDADGDIRKLTSVVDYVFDKSIKKGLMKGGGMSQINLVSEAMDKRQGAETLKQLGGNRFIAMTGAKHFGVGPNGMSFKIGKNSKRVNHVTIDYDRGRDLYNMKFDWVTIKGIKNKKTLKGIYADQLQDMFTRYTGMYTSL